MNIDGKEIPDSSNLVVLIPCKPVPLQLTFEVEEPPSLPRFTIFNPILQFDVQFVPSAMIILVVFAD